MNHIRAAVANVAHFVANEQPVAVTTAISAGAAAYVGYRNHNLTVGVVEALVVAVLGLFAHSRVTPTAHATQAGSDVPKA